ncbi:uncharacterized protein MONBRDRAFT_15178 [Monosiga brevicollis MX1]|uniref:ABC transporter domain-containing protein n=1 Tax=Monosiga brevicollis TaxID=81824 RepID=A9UU91_MONBE|nr:uncharacterized protein MONBRDRAFT_15178 [Monosiga brevicollis MX1]EDQ91381.1 predicted protein [Monosiga brevicollis MX1]|eukprot:XP_001743803.1 hypothetical protein [Monosiga brevicollis MX1]
MRGNRPSVSIAYRHLGFVVNGNKRILHDLSGEIKGGELVALMGPSGAGKSTLLNVLAGFRTRQSEGRVLINGHDRDLKRYRKMACFVMQDDVLFKNLTVAEYLMISCNLRFDPEMTVFEKKQIIQSIGIAECLDRTVIQLSGGQRKRLAVALEIVSDPPLLFLDEPTSGLDSTSAVSLVEMLRSLAQSGRTVVASIHQPSATLFELFDRTVVLSGGQILYDGPVNEVVPYFKSQNVECPAYHNPADFLLEVANGVKGSPAALLTNWRNDHPPGEVALGDQVAVCAFSTPLPTLFPYALHSRGRGLYPISVADQFKILLKRAFKDVIRDTLLTRMRAGAHVAVGIIIGVLYLHQGVHSDKIPSVVGYYFFSLLFLMLASVMPTVLSFPIEKEIFAREHLNNWYSVKAYYFAKSLSDFPFQVVFPIIYMSISYWMTDQPSEAGRFFKVLAAAVLHTQVAQAMGIVISTAAPTPQVAVFMAPMSSIPMMLFSGFFVLINGIPIALRWLTFLSYFRFTLQAMLIAILKDKKLDCVGPPASDGSCVGEYVGAQGLLLVC